MLARVSEQEGPWRHQFATGGRAILKRARGDDRDAHVRELLFKPAVPWSGITDHVPRAPSVSLRQKPPGGTANRSAFDPSHHHWLVCDRNFRQESRPLSPYTVAMIARNVGTQSVPGILIAQGRPDRWTLTSINIWQGHILELDDRGWRLEVEVHAERLRTEGA